MGSAAQPSVFDLKSELLSDKGTLKILAYTPYVKWWLHGYQESTLLSALRARGCEVMRVMCDGLMTECDLISPVKEQRKPDDCLQCQTEATKSSFACTIPWKWMSHYITESQLAQAREWIDDMHVDEYDGATFGDWRIDEWVRGSVQNALRSAILDTNIAIVRDTWRKYLYSGLVAAFALNTMLEVERPDILMLYNGRRASLRVAFEIARHKGIRVICHERGLRPQTIRIWENEICTSLNAINDLWEQRKNIPLAEEEQVKLDAYLEGRGECEGFSLVAFSEPRSSAKMVADKPYWLIVTSSEDEKNGDPHYDGGPFANQREWLAATLRWAAKHPDMLFVVRVHPNTGMVLCDGRMVGEWMELERVLLNAPPNVVIYRACHPASTYLLMDNAEMVINYQSTIGVEAACIGKPVIVCGKCPVYGKPFVRTVRNTSDYELILDQGAEAIKIDVDAAKRFAYAMFFVQSIDFPLVEQTSPYESKPAYSSVVELLPGCDVNLDKICQSIIGEKTCVTN